LKKKNQIPRELNEVIPKNTSSGGVRPRSFDFSFTVFRPPDSCLIPAKNKKNQKIKKIKS
jgi:hypothetical protein